MNPLKKAAIGVALVGSTITGGAIGAAFVNGSALAQTENTPATTAAPASPGDRGPRGPHRGDRANVAVTGDAAEKAKAAALEAVPGATVDSVETNADASLYKVKVTKADGTKAVVILDKDFKVTSVKDCGDRGPRPAPGTAPAPAPAASNADA